MKYKLITITLLLIVGILVNIIYLQYKQINVYKEDADMNRRAIAKLDSLLTKDGGKIK